MNIYRFASTVGVVLAFCVGSCSGFELTTEQEKILYALGLSFSRSAFPFDLSPSELEIVKQGLSDGVALRPKIDSLQYMSKVSELARQRLSETAKEQRLAGQLYLSKAAERPGAVKTTSGLVLETLAVGNGAALKSTDKVLLNVRGTTIDNTEIQSGQDTITVVVSKALLCWSEALVNMRVGGKSRLTCPAELTYRDVSGPFLTKAGATLVFEIEVKDVVPTQPALAK